MNLYTISTFRDAIASLTKKPREGYSSLITDICTELQSMPINILRDSNERILQTSVFRVVKLRLCNSGQKLSKSKGFRLVYYISLKTDEMVLLTVFPKRGAKGISNIPSSEYKRMLNALIKENDSHQLHQVDISNGLVELNQNSCLSIF